MGLVSRKMKIFIRPYSPRERIYAIFGKKLENQDKIFFNKYEDEHFNVVKTIYIIFSAVSSLAVITAILTLMTLYLAEQYWSTMVDLTYHSFFITGFIYFVFFVPYLAMGIYTRSWIKLLENKNIIPKFTFFQKLTGKYSSILYPKVKSYLESNNISLFITEDEIRSVAPVSVEFDKIKREHVKFDNSVIKYNV